MQIIDDSDAITVYNIPGFVICKPSDGLIVDITEEILNNGNVSGFAESLKSGNLQIVSENIIAFTSIINNNEVRILK